MEDARAGGEDALACSDLRKAELRVELGDAGLQDNRRGELLHAPPARGELRRAVGREVRLVHTPRRKPERPGPLLALSEHAHAGRERLRAHLVVAGAAEPVVREIVREANAARSAAGVLHLHELKRGGVVYGREHAPDNAQRAVRRMRLGAPHAVKRNRVHDLAARLAVRRQARHLVLGEVVDERAVGVVRLHAQSRPHHPAPERQRPVGRDGVGKDERCPKSAHLEAVGVWQPRIVRDVPDDPPPVVREAPA